MRAAKICFSIVFLVILASNIRSISHWTESRGVWDDVCYLRQAHLFQRFGWHALDTSLARDDDGYLTAKLRSVGYPDWNDLTQAPCHHPTADGSKRVMTPPPGTGFVLSLFPEGFQVIPLFVSANVAIAGFALFALWRAQRPGALALAGLFGAMSIYFMINPTKASYSMAPTMVVCALVGLLTAQSFVDGNRRQLLMAAVIGILLGGSANFRIANVLLGAGYFLFFGLSFLIHRSRARLLEGLSFGLAFVVGILPFLTANAVNSGNPLVAGYAGQDTALPTIDLAVLQAYVSDIQFPLIVFMCAWTALLWYFGGQTGVRRLALLVAGNLAVNLAYFGTHPVFTQYYTIPISMLSQWTLLFAMVLTHQRPQTDQARGSDEPRLSAGLSHELA